MARSVRMKYISVYFHFCLLSLRTGKATDDGLTCNTHSLTHTEKALYERTNFAMLFAHFSHLSARLLPEDSSEAFMDSRRRYTGFPGRWMKTFFTAYFCGLLKAVVAAAADVPEMPSYI